MEWKDIAGAVGKAAPILGTLLGGPAGAAVGSIIASAIGTGADPAEVERAISADPAALVKLREIEASKTVRLQELAADMAKAEIQTAAADRASAREREAKTGDTFTPRVLALLFVVGWFFVQSFLLLNVIEDGMREIVMRSMGTLDMALGLVLSYYFGSSAGSRAKDDTINNAVPPRRVP